MIISKQTATDIAFAYREVESAEGLLKQIEDAMSRRETVDIRDAFGRSQDGLQLGVPTGATGHRLFNVPWRLARPILEAHIAGQLAIIRALTEKARGEIEG